MKQITLLFFLLSSFLLQADSIKEAVFNDNRSSENVIRDQYRHPYETLSFFKITPDMTVVELSPGGGWYTEILANLLSPAGKLIAAHFDKNSESDFLKRSRAKFENKMKNNPMYQEVNIVDLNSKLATQDSVDAILTFRNLHNWLGPLMDTIFENSFNALKPGGIFGVVEHRANPRTTLKKMKDSGYVTEAYAIEIAKKHGFEFIAKSEINANPKDYKDYPKGVWTLPPTLRLKEEDKNKYLEIGESDRMTLLFKKPI